MLTNLMTNLGNLISNEKSIPVVPIDSNIDSFQLPNFSDTDLSSNISCGLGCKLGEGCKLKGGANINDSLQLNMNVILVICFMFYILFLNSIYSYLNKLNPYILKNKNKKNDCLKTSFVSHILAVTLSLLVFISLIHFLLPKDTLLNFANKLQN